MHTIQNEQDLGGLVAESSSRPVLIFKHSSACPVSSKAHAEIRKLLEDQQSAGFGFGMVVVQDARAISNAIEQQLGIRHETPQVIVLRDGRAVWNASHWDVTRDRVAAALEGA